MDSPHPIYTPENFRPKESLGRLIAEVSGLLLSALDEEMAELGISGAQWVVLVRVATDGPVTAASLCRCLRYDTGSMTRMLDRLEDKGFIRRVRSQEDRRIIHLELSEAGKVLYPHLPPVAIKVLNQHLRGFSEDELRLFRSFLERMIINADQTP